jgi:hypothetical protein
MQAVTSCTVSVQLCMSVYIQFSVCHFPFSGYNYKAKVVTQGILNLFWYSLTLELQIKPMKICKTRYVEFRRVTKPRRFLGQGYYCVIL